ncbi:BLUF domain-containing protein [Curtobacterium caseinilyticum]|uniref:BLUF domain-containing protein n=1 Tax=Curtobacterium caseinilyticum TaxID=3055137 RepID=A0ABT7TM57_9MICO|nr:BLUF domain-containing protein [Curtobacterium caseinilyticum]MDM7890665.1 BLUF domain-containing protein [Curtobacterium caseinilyticum]
MTQLTSLVYMSVAVDEMTDDQLVAMLREARLRNDALGVSGLLLAKGGRFMQVLEGPAWSVEDRYAAIERDPRHRDVKSLSRESIETRRFDGWSMAFGNPSDADVRDEPGFNTFLTGRSGLPAELAGSPADWLLRWFRGRDLQDVPEEQMTLARHAA